MPVLYFVLAGSPTARRLTGGALAVGPSTAKIRIVEPEPGRVGRVDEVDALVRSGDQFYTVRMTRRFNNDGTGGNWELFLKTHLRPIARDDVLKWIYDRLGYTKSTVLDVLEVLGLREPSGRPLPVPAAEPPPAPDRQPPAAPAVNRGRRRNAARDADDDRITEEWDSRRHAEYVDLANALGKSKSEVKAAVERVRQRRKK